MFEKIRSQIGAFWQNRRYTSTGRSVRVDFYTRNGCCLCDEALNVIEKVGRSYALELHVIDVDQTQSLVVQYGDRVPVVIINGRERFHGRINRILLERLFYVESTQG